MVTFSLLSISYLTSLFVISRCEAGWQFSASSEEEYCRISDSNGICIQQQEQEVLQDPNCFRAAVYEHQRLDKEGPKETADVNEKIFERVAKLAAKSGANILVFPEDGLFMRERTFMDPISEQIVDPKKLNTSNNIPCLQPSFFKGCDKLIRFSCLARNNNLYIVVNYGTKETCTPGEKFLDTVCPGEGKLLLNTDIVFDLSGRYIERYRKYNLFMEYFDKAPRLETVYFDTSFGRFGVFTCFDMMFKKPAVDLVEKHHIDTVIFPTWWYDELPLLTAIQFQDAWSATHKVNLLASNIHKKSLGSVGSSIISGNRFVYTAPKSTGSKLLLADIPKKSSFSSECSQGFNSKILDVHVDNAIEDDYTYKTYSLLDTDRLYNLTLREEIKTICASRVCCSVDYKLYSDLLKKDVGKLVLIVRDGVRPGYYNWYEQVCTIATLNSPFNEKDLSAISYAKNAIVSFERLILRGTFNTKYVYPVSAHNIDHLLSRDRRKFNCDKVNEKQQKDLYSCQLEFNGTHNADTIYSFGLYGRLYENDKMPEGW